MTASILAKLLHLYDTHGLVYQDGSEVWYQQDAMELFEDARKARNVIGGSGDER